ncbi:MAG: phospho-N-acetylmuramoyl-pentapeptide-transferase [Bacteroidales bacterium]|nr:phospho-N-acetylmuramoyl-pentapeptide-transferase [Bacteroidales bacterium]MDD3009860.1 phospho-N-acetylmuramoyl-pentapeptide-transferase [Bacteroidales bacterium]MDD3960924.1 phospho-N-acetylmuramoyl-pentapeptide-transferase [Bacteroidales bacterium]MDY0286849.1 phospho-N-acetylmuramoyl-pentapeptide-transferase [Bacteroidales bacterium]HPE85703.1 phospho-N-acetylmuramoyl-pentapeptide-transferase [Bacteroidales bacterium]
MFYYLFDYIDKIFDIPGTGVFQYISFRAACSFITSLIISMLIGKKLIRLLQKKQVGETVRDLGLTGQNEKEGTPTMGGIIILLAIIVPTLLFAQLHNIYILLILFCTVWLGLFGFLDDYIKVFKKDKKGLAGKFKLLGQLVLGIIVGATMFFHQDIVIREKNPVPVVQESTNYHEEWTEVENPVFGEPVKSTKTTIPFFKNNELEYSKILSWAIDDINKWAWLIFIPIVIFIVMAISNGANLTDGLDGLATGSSAIVGATLGIFAWVSGNIVFSDYLNIMYIPHVGELTVFISAFVGACLGFLWYNSYPAQVFMGDTGSLALGGIIAVFAIMIRKELLLPILCGVFLAENLSVIIQVSWFKHTKRKYGQGKRVFLMSPLHHHYQKKGYPEAKIVMRFLLVGMLLAVIAVVTLKLR